MAFATNMAAMNAARKQFGKEWKEFAKVEKLDGQWYVQIAPSEAVHAILDAKIDAAGLPKDLKEEHPEDQFEALQAAPAGWESVEGGTVQDQPERGANWPFPKAPVPQDGAGALEIAACELIRAEKEADHIANAAASEVDLPGGKVWVKQSSAEKPTKLVWAIADEMRAANPEATRKEIQDECVRRGIASGTARTQYQAWKKCNDEVKANSAKAAELSARFNGK